MLPALLPALLLSACSSAPTLPVSGAQVFLLVGQSNMSGRGVGADPLAGAPGEPRLLMWNPAAARLSPARDPMPQQDIGQKPVAVGPGISFGRAWLSASAGRATGPVVLVPAAYGGTGFSDAARSWRVTGPAVSPLVAEAVTRANAAMRAAGPSARFAGILWLQGETDGGNGMAPAAYTTELRALVSYLRSHIDGAGDNTPFVVGQYVPSQITASPALRAIAEENRALPRTLAHSACVGSTGLSGNPAPDTIHFDAASQRAMGERYAAAMARAQQGSGDAACDW